MVPAILSRDPLQGKQNGTPKSGDRLNI